MSDNIGYGVFFEYTSKCCMFYETLMNGCFLYFNEFVASNLFAKTQLALSSTFTALMLWIEVFWIVMEPPLRYLWHWQMNLSPHQLYIEFGLVVTFAVVYLIRKWLQKKQFLKRIKSYTTRLKSRVDIRYQRIVSDIEKKSKIVALIFPHIVYFGIALLFCRMFPRIAVSLTSDALVEKVVILVRVFFTFSAIFEAEQSTDAALAPITQTPVTSPSFAQRILTVFTPSGSTTSSEAMANLAMAAPSTPRSPIGDPHQLKRRAQSVVRANLMHWIVFALFLCTQRVASLLPLLGFFGRLVGADDRLRLFYALTLLWLQLPIGAVEVAYEYIVPLLEHHAPVLFSPPTRSSSSQQRVQQLGGLLKLLAISGLVSEDRAKTIREVCSDGWVLLGATFFFTPPMFTQYGVLLCGLLYPAACSALLVTDHAASAFSSQVRWLKYWSVYALILHAGHELESTGLWSFMIGANYAHLLLVMYLQLPYFRGATRGHAFLTRLLGNLLSLLLGGDGRSDSQGLSRGVDTGKRAISHSQNRTDKEKEMEEIGDRVRPDSIRRRRRRSPDESKNDIPSAAAAIQAEMMDSDSEKEKNE